MKHVKVGIISFAHGHANSFTRSLRQLDEVELVGIADDHIERGEKAAQRYKTVHYESYHDLLKQDIDAVVITSENVNHHKHVVAAARAKKHILCEKPLATTVEDAKNMIDVCEENNVKLQVAFPVRFNTSIEQTKAMIDAGQIGDIVAIKGTNRGRNPGGWFVDKSLSGGGAVIDHTVHLVDTMRWMMDAEVSEVYAESDQLFSDVSIDDAGIVTLQFTNDVFATIDCSWSRHKNYTKGGDVILKIIGTKGILNVDANQQNLDLHSIEKKPSRQFWGDRMTGKMIQDFISNIQHDQDPTITGFDGLKTVEVALAAYESSNQHKPIQITQIK